MDAAPQATRKVRASRCGCVGPQGSDTPLASPRVRNVVQAVGRVASEAMPVLIKAEGFWTIYCDLIDQKAHKTYKTYKTYKT